MIGMIVHYTDTAGRTGIGYVTSRDEAAGTFRVCPAAGCRHRRRRRRMRPDRRGRDREQHERRRRRVRHQHGR